MARPNRLADALSEVISVLTVLAVLGLCLLDTTLIRGLADQDVERAPAPPGPATIDELVEDVYRQKQP
ncbi:MAG: hypothetical protein V2I51_09050 [Anderseniella sp.]|jgi:hypothetical protein|nr:hypothetical protein [Anderseniella sp.]